MRLNLMFIDLFNVAIEQASEMISQARVSIGGPVEILVETPPVQVAVRIFYVLKLTIVLRRPMILLSCRLLSLSITVGRSEFEVGSGGHWNEVPSCCASGSFRRVLLGSIGHAHVQVHGMSWESDKRLLL